MGFARPRSHPEMMMNWLRVAPFGSGLSAQTRDMLTGRGGSSNSQPCWRSPRGAFADDARGHHHKPSVHGEAGSRGVTLITKPLPGRGSRATIEISTRPPTPHTPTRGQNLCD